MAKKIEREIIVKFGDYEPPNWEYLAELITQQILKEVNADGEIQRDFKGN